MQAFLFTCNDLQHFGFNVFKLQNRFQHRLHFRVIQLCTSFKFIQQQQCVRGVWWEASCKKWGEFSFMSNPKRTEKKTMSLLPHNLVHSVICILFFFFLMCRYPMLSEFSISPNRSECAPEPEWARPSVNQTETQNKQDSSLPSSVCFLLKGLKSDTYASTSNAVSHLSSPLVLVNFHLCG